MYVIVYILGNRMLIVVPKMFEDGRFDDMNRWSNCILLYACR